MKNKITIFDINTKEEKIYMVTDRVKRMLDAVKSNTNDVLFIIHFGVMAKEAKQCL